MRAKIAAIAHAATMAPGKWWLQSVVEIEYGFTSRKAGDAARPGRLFSEDWFGTESIGA